VKLVVDTNILISCLLKPEGRVGELFFHPLHRPDLFAPERMLSELVAHRPKVLKLAGLPAERIGALEELLVSRITIVSNSAVASPTWERAYDLVKDIDEDDDQFVALALHLNCPLWTGDGKLLRGLRRKGFKLLMTNDDLRKELGT
jgi:predicted nucleic acid-binding protein